MLQCVVSLARKKQSRVWCVCMVYKCFVLDKKVMYLDAQTIDANRLSEILGDDVIFSYTKGDTEYFVVLNNFLANNFLAINLRMEQILDTRSIGALLKSCLVCAICEIVYMKIDHEIVIPEYIRIMESYGETDEQKSLSKLASITY